MPGHPREQNLADVKKCVTFLKDLEVTWNGASKSRAIIEQLMHESASKFGVTSKRTLTDLDEPISFSWDQVPGSELFGFDISGADLLNSWLP